MNTSLSNKQKLLIITLLLVIASFFLALWQKGMTAATIITTALLVILWITRAIWLPDGHGKTLVRKYSLWVILAVATSVTFWDQIVASFIIIPAFKFLQANFDIFKGVPLPSITPSITILIFVLAGILIINYFIKEPALAKHKTPISKEFPEKSFKDDLRHFCKMLGRHLDLLDDETSWSEMYYVPLDAEVEVKIRNRKKKKVTNLLRAIRKNRSSQTFLVLGDPGSGKSVALRTLASALLKEVNKSGVVPIYVNLREWEVETPWTKANPPTVEQLRDFLIENVKERGDVYFHKVVDKYLEKMIEYGRIFFLIDSFDETPAVLDEDQGSWLIDELSNCIDKVIGGAHNSRGLLASRVFRKPTNKFTAKVTLEVRPFTEEKIIKNFKSRLSGYNTNLA